MKRVALGIILGAAAGAGGAFVYELTDQRIWGWLAIGVLLGVISQLPHLGKLRWFWWGLLGGGIILVGCYLGTTIGYPIWLVWSFFGALFGFLCSRKGLQWRIGGGVIGALGGTVGISLLPLITVVILPSLGLPTTFDYDLDVLGLVVVGAFVGGTTAWLKGK